MYAIFGSFAIPAVTEQVDTDAAHTPSHLASSAHNTGPVDASAKTIKPNLKNFIRELPSSETDTEKRVCFFAATYYRSC